MSVNPEFLESGFRPNRKRYTATDLIEGINLGNRTLLSKAITLVESDREDHNHLAQEILEALLPKVGNSIRVGITGVPGVGKSTFIESFGNYLITQGFRVAVLAIDPSSKRTKGSILGDKTRMEALSKSERAFIRPSPSSGTLGGVARKTRETMFLCEAFGFDVILVETVGVGQSETQVHGMVDFFLLLMLAGAGDELQGIKRGIMELADFIAINKADGANAPFALRARAEYESALHLFPLRESKWIPKALTCSGQDGLGIPEIWQTISDFQSLVKGNGYFESNRKQQSQNWFEETLREAVLNKFFQKPGLSALVKEAEKRVIESKSPILLEIQKILKFEES